MPGNLRALMNEVPRPLQIVARDSIKEQHPLNSKPISERETMARLEPLMGLIAAGHVPLDQHAARAVATYVNGFHKRAR